MTSDAATEIAALLRGRVLVVTGAGVSAESSIPTFRGADGYWRNHNPVELATVEAFSRDPALVWKWYDERRALIRSARPNPAHQSIAELSRTSSDHLVVTQNVDDLHERGGTAPERLVHMHGEIFLTQCTHCDYVTRELVLGAGLPRCPVCQSLLRPGVVWFDEELDPMLVERIERFLSGPVDVVLAVGTTATFDYIVDWMTRKGTLVEINPNETAASRHARYVIRRPAGEVLPQLVARAR